MNYNPYANQLNPYQQLDVMRQQIAQQYQQPYMQQPGIPQGMPAQGLQPAQQQVPNIQLLIQQEIQRQLGMAPQQQQQQLMPPAQPQMSPGQAILSTIGGHLTQADQVWLSNNLNGLPGFFNTTDGRELIQLAISGYRKHMGAEE